MCSYILYGSILPNVFSFYSNSHKMKHPYKCRNIIDSLPFSQVFEVYDSLPEPSLKTMDRVVSSAIDLCTFIYLSVGIAGYLAFADTNFTGSLFHYF